jgi:hypothetical protein
MKNIIFHPLNQNLNLNHLMPFVLQSFLDVLQALDHHPPPLMSVLVIKTLRRVILFCMIISCLAVLVEYERQYFAVPMGVLLNFVTFMALTFQISSPYAIKRSALSFTS